MSIKVGDIVYPGYTPAKIGVVVKIFQPPDKPVMVRLGAPKGVLNIHQVLATNNLPLVPDPSGKTFTPFPTYTVRQPNGKEYESQTLRLYSSLLEETRKKLHTHETAYNKVDAFRKTLVL